MPDLNVDLLRKTLDHIECHPERWNQNLWVDSCGTAYCFAGHATVLDLGYAPKLQVGSSSTGMFTMSSGTKHDFAEYAREALGLTVEQSDVLFHGENNLDDLREWVALFITEYYTRTAGKCVLCAECVSGVQKRAAMWSEMEQSEPPVVCTGFHQPEDGYWTCQGCGDVVLGQGYLFRLGEDAHVYRA